MEPLRGAGSCLLTIASRQLLVARPLPVGAVTQQLTVLAGSFGNSPVIRQTAKQFLPDVTPSSLSKCHVTSQAFIALVAAMVKDLFWLLLFCCPIICVDLQCCSSWHPTSVHAQDLTHITAPPSRSTGDVISLVGCHPKEALHCC